MFRERNEKAEHRSEGAERPSVSYTQLPPARVCRTESERRVKSQRSNNGSKRKPRACEADGAMAYYFVPLYR